MKTTLATEKDKALEIVRTAKTDRARAEQFVLALVNELAPELGVKSAVINESKLSLNSVNGRLDSDDKKYFFKFHAEEGEMQTLKSEYYNAKLLAQNGWPMVEPVFASPTPGSQFVVYDYIDAPVAYDLYAAEDDRFIGSGSYDNDEVEALLSAECVLADKICEGFLKSLKLSDASEIEKTSLNQLFYNRLAVGTPADPPRLEKYYLGKDVVFLNGKSVPFNELAKLSWTINGVRYADSLEMIIERAKNLLNPSKEAQVPSVIGHGDDHNGNKFFINGEFKFYDPAFAGRHPALLSFIKATAHNVFLHPFWLYEPEKLVGKLNIEVEIKESLIAVNHNWKLEERSPLRMKILDIYAKEGWRPLMAELSNRGWLPDYWQEYIHSALFCCPFLVLNLLDSAKYAPAQSILALSKCVELGSKGDRETLVDRFFTSIASRV